MFAWKKCKGRLVHHQYAEIRADDSGRVSDAINYSLDKGALLLDGGFRPPPLIYFAVKVPVGLLQFKTSLFKIGSPFFQLFLEASLVCAFFTQQPGALQYIMDCNIQNLHVKDWLGDIIPGAFFQRIGSILDSSLA